MHHNSRRHAIRASIREFIMPPIDDGLILGRESPIGHMAIARALNLLTVTPYEHVLIDDDVIGDVLVRSAVLRKITVGQLRDFVLREVKPMMGPEEIIHLELDIEVLIEREGS